MLAVAKFFLDNRKFTIVLTLGLMLYGYMGLKALSSETFPSVNIGVVIVTTVYPGASAEDIESKITRPLEKEIRGVRGLKEVKSVSQPSISRINVVIDIDYYDVDEVVSDLQRAIDRTTDLPPDLDTPPHFFEVKSEEFPVIELAVIGSNENRARDKIADELKEELEDNKAISTITLTGFMKRRFNILLSQEKLQKYHVGINEVISKLKSQNINIPGGDVESKSGQKIVRIEGKRRTVEDLSKLVVRSNFSGERILLKDIATIVDGEEDPETLAMFEGKPATLVTIAKKGGADIITLSDQVKVAIKKFEKKYGEGHQFKIYNDEGLRVKNRVGILSSNGLVGLILVVVFLFIFLPGPVGLMTAVSLPLALMATIGLIQSYGYTLNTITILALVIALGMLVDNAVVISENFVRLKEEGVETEEALITTIRDLWAPISATALTTIAAFAPMLVTKGIIGEFISGIPVVVTLALGFSLLEGYFLLPVRLVLVQNSVKKTVKEKKTDWFDKYVLPKFQVIVTWLVYHRYKSAGIFGGLIFGAIFMMAFANKFILFPADQTEIYIARVELDQAALIETTEEKLEVLTQEMRKTLGDKAAYVVAKAGISEQDFGDPKSRRGDNVGMLFIFMTEDAKNNEITNNVLKEMRKIKLDGVENLSFEAMINGPPIGDPITVTFRSNDEKQVYALTDEIIAFLKEKKGVFDVRIDDVFGPNEIYIDVDPIKSSRLGLSHAAAGSMIRTAIAGEILGDVTLENKDVDYFLRFEAKNRESIENIKNVRVSDMAGNLISVSQIADVVEKKGTPQIKRFDFKRAKTITANIDDSIITSIEANSQIADFFESITAKYPDVTLDYGGEAERTAESMQSLFQALILSIVGIFALLVLLFNSYVRPLVILTTIPLGLVGVSLAFFLHNRPFSFLAMTGVIGLGGIIVNSGIVLISFIDQLRAEKPDRKLEEVLIDAASLRLRAVIVTSLTTVCGLLPTAYGIGGADEFIIPMTMALAWGLVTGTILAILWVPSAYAITEDVNGWITSKTRSLRLGKR
jgi:multidrug efflux pump subunit AcrB